MRTTNTKHNSLRKQARRDAEQEKKKKEGDSYPSRIIIFKSPTTVTKTKSANSSDDTDSVTPSPNLTGKKYCITLESLAYVLGSMVSDKLSYTDDEKKNLVQ